MTHEEKINYFRLAANLNAFGMEDKHADFLVSVYELILEKQGEATILDIAKIQAKVSERHEE